MRALPHLTLLGVLTIPAVGRAANVVYLSSAGTDEEVLSGRRLRITESPATPFSVYSSPDGRLAVAVTDDTTGTRYWLYFMPPPGQRFAPGSYDGAADCGLSGRPGVCVERDFARPVAGHLEVLDAAHDASGNLIRFAADFVQYGVVTASALTGSIRLASGDGACTGVADGTACDDLDACTASSSCANGRCVATATTDCGGPAAGDCHDAAVCDPAVGTCAAPTLWNDGISCRSEDRCAFISYCAAGVCAMSVPRFCDDADACTYDTCDTRTGCAHAPIPGVCGRPGPPGAFVFLRRIPGDVFGMSLPHVYGPENGVAISIDGAGAARLLVFDLASGARTLTFAAPSGTPLVEGAYENAGPYRSVDPGRSGLEVLPAIRPPARASRARCSGTARRATTRPPAPTAGRARTASASRRRVPATTGTRAPGTCATARTAAGTTWFPGAGSRPRGSTSPRRRAERSRATRCNVDPCAASRSERASSSSRATARTGASPARRRMTTGAPSRFPTRSAHYGRSGAGSSACGSRIVPSCSRRSGSATDTGCRSRTSSGSSCPATAPS